MAVLPGDVMVYRRGLKALGIQPLRLLSRYNTVPATRPPLRPELRRALARELTDDVRRLESVLDRSLTCWMDFAPASALAPAPSYPQDPVRRLPLGSSRSGPVGGDLISLEDSVSEPKSRVASQ
jgi:hypothetical protein